MYEAVVLFESPIDIIRIPELSEKLFSLGPVIGKKLKTSERRKLGLVKIDDFLKGSASFSGVFEIGNTESEPGVIFSQAVGMTSASTNRTARVIATDEFIKSTGDAVERGGNKSMRVDRKQSVRIMETETFKSSTFVQDGMRNGDEVWRD